MAGKQLSDGNPTGTTLGQDATDLISFHGASPCDQSPKGTAVSTPVVSIGGYGFTSSTTLFTLTAAIDAILVCLKEKGLMSST